MGSLALKLVVTPALIAAATLAGRRFGRAAGGWIVALPLTTGPVVFFVTLAHGRAFGAAAAVGALGGAVAEVAFSLAYRRAAAHSWPVALGAASVAFAVVAVAVRLLRPGAGLPLPLLPLAVGVALALALGLAVLGRGRSGRRLAATVQPPGGLVGRMAVATGVVLALTAAAPALGPRLAGLLATYPLLTAVLAAAAHREEGPGAALEVLRGLLLGLYALAAFFVTVAVLLPRAGLGAAFAAAALAALASQALTARAMRRT